MITCKDQVVLVTGPIDEVLCDYDKISEALVSRGIPAALLMSAGSVGLKRALETQGITDREQLLKYLSASFGGNDGE